jgi:glyoxylase-like metal-dependent hydrolase (beta-lactamase superfamily II)
MDIDRSAPAAPKLDVARNKAGLSGRSKLAVLAGALMMIATASAAQQRPAAKSAAAPAALASKVEPLEVLNIRKNVFLIAGAGGNVVVQSGPDGLLLVDTGNGSRSEAVLAELAKISQGKLRFIINTNARTEHVGGNAAIGSKGGSIADRPLFGFNDSGALIYAHENVLRSVGQAYGERAAMPSAAWPTDVYFGEETDLYFNDEPIKIYYQPAAATNGDSLVHFRSTDVIVTGDVFLTTSYPDIDLQNGGSLQGVIDALNRLLTLTVAADKQEGGTLVIPGHGRVCDEADVAEYRDMLTIIRDRMKDLIGKGLTFDQARAMQPTLEYDARYGAESSPVTARSFLETVYRDLSR